jgi:hypothetical protein
MRFRDVALNTTSDITGTIILDTEDPACGTWTYEPPLTTWTNGIVTATLA